MSELAIAQATRQERERIKDVIEVELHEELWDLKKIEEQMLELGYFVGGLLAALADATRPPAGFFML
jgi:hypothetical protein